MRETTAQEILTAAEQVFIERGIHNAHMADIAAAAGVAVGTLYNHYKDRDALVQALADQRRSEMLQLIDECLARSESLPFREQLREVWLVIFRHWEKHWQFYSIFMQAECGPPIMAKPSLAIQKEIYGRWEQLIERGRKQRALRPKMAELAPTLLMGMTRSLLVRRLFTSIDDSPLLHIDTLVDFFLQGAGGRTP